MYTIKTTLFILLNLILVSSLTAQLEEEPKREEDKRTFTMGIIAGLNASQIDGDEFAGYDKLGANVGLRAGLKIHKHWETSFEILYNQKGSSSQFRTKNRATYIKYIMDYVEIPVMMNYTDWNIKFSAGFSYGRLIRNDIKAFIDGEKQPVNLDLYSKHDLSFVGGLTVFPTKKIGINLRFTRSMLNLIKDSNNGKQVNKLISLRGMYIF